MEDTTTRLHVSRRTLVIAAQMLVFAIFVGFAYWALRGDIGDAADALEEASWIDFGIGCVFIAAYYLVFVLGFRRILGDWGVPITYLTSLRAEMVSMLAKYIPGGIWTPAARIVALRRAGVTDTALVGATMFVEASLSAVSGVLVFVLGLRWVHGVDAPLAPLILFALLLILLLHPRIFHATAGRIVRRFGGTELPDVRWRLLLQLLVFYSGTWLIGGLGLFFLVRAVGGDPPLSSVPFLGGVSAVGAIVAVLAIFAPSGLGPREASMYGLMLAVASEGAALGATVLNRVAITLVELLLLLVGGIALRHLQDDEAEPAVQDAPA
jgi:uncharacterized membrane protein YbhN (UPF0104 family)